MSSSALGGPAHTWLFAAGFLVCSWVLFILHVSEQLPSDRRARRRVRAALGWLLPRAGGARVFPAATARSSRVHGGCVKLTLYGRVTCEREQPLSGSWRLF